MCYKFVLPGSVLKPVCPFPTNVSSTCRQYFDWNLSLEKHVKLHSHVLTIEDIFRNLLNHILKQHWHKTLYDQVNCSRKNKPSGFQLIYKVVNKIIHTTEQKLYKSLQLIVSLKAWQLSGTLFFHYHPRGIYIVLQAFILFARPCCIT